MNRHAPLTLPRPEQQRQHLPKRVPALLLGLSLCIASLPAHCADGTGTNWQAIRELALRNNPELQQARQSVEGARADLERATLRPNPTLTLSDSSWTARQSPFGQVADLTARIDQTIERGDKRGLRTAQGKAGLQAARLDALRAERSLLTRVIAAIVDLDTARKKLVAAQEIAVALSRTQDIARRRFKAGDLSEVAADRVVSDSIRAENDVTTARSELFEARQTLRTLLGHDPDHVVDADHIDVGSLPGFSLTGVTSPDSADNALAGLPMPELEAARQREQAAARALDLAKAQRARDISVGIQVERPSYASGTVLGLSVSLPLLIYNDYSADIRRATSDQLAAQIETRRLSLQLLDERSRLVNALHMAHLREARLRDQALPVAIRNAQTTEFAFQRGAASVLEVLDAQRTMHGVQVEVLAARADRLRAASALALLADPGLRALHDPGQRTLDDPPKSVTP